MPATRVGLSSRVHPTVRGSSIDPQSFPLMRRLYGADRVPEGGSLLTCRVPLLGNADVSVFFARPTESDDVFFANGDGDELWFVQEGELTLESVCGWISAKAGDYVFVPRSMIHRWHVVRGPVRAMLFEAHGSVHVPREFRNGVGQLRMDAPYTHRDFVRPEAPRATWSSTEDGPRTLVVKKSDTFTEYEQVHFPMDVIGWDGFVYPWAFAIEKYQAKVGLVHLPPTIHGTFAGRGFLVCSFVPRPVDFHPQAIPCPYPHSSVECDEIILYLRGNFTSRKGVGPGSLSFHPAGVAHGPHPGAYEASIGTTRTDELAVMMDCEKPLVPTTYAASLEVPGYHASWTA
jgi:homogentisate 1,2-dioxygenase